MKDELRRYQIYWTLFVKYNIRQGKTSFNHIITICQFLEMLKRNSQLYVDFKTTFDNTGKT